MSEFPKQYDPKIAEPASQSLWEEKKIYLPKDEREELFPEVSQTRSNSSAERAPEGDVQGTYGEGGVKRQTGSTSVSETSTFYIPIPPPNVTGNLHLGHALTLTLEDIMTRYHRMKGDSTLWVPGTDHAGIATQAQVEKRCEKNGTPRKTLGRERFLEECWKWIDEYGGNIQNQIRLMGASVDWSKERFTFDKQSNELVEKVFVDLYNKGLIYRGEYMVNYSPVLESVISDIEVDYEEVEEKMYYINYFVSGSDKELLVATTRPETLLADQAVAVHPKDKRYKKLIGRSVVLPIVNKEIPIIGDEMVDMEFGTGVVKITPAHDPADFETGKRHNLRLDYRVIDKNGIMTTEAGPFAGQKGTEEARNNIVELLRAKGNLVKVEPYKHKVGFCSRGKCRIESVVSTQWFVRANIMAEKVIAGHKKKEFVIMPERFNKTFEDWIYNLRDWCISRQLWWGHQIPAYYDTNTNELLGVTRDPIELIKKQCEKYNLDASVIQGLTRDPVNNNESSSAGFLSTQEGQKLLLQCNIRRDDDVLDTWFSSALWPFSILNWDFENPSELFQKFYPATVLETGYDILFFWVIRMFLMGYEYTGQTPFKTVYLHGLILDEHGKKMSKSWGNVIDPLVVIDQYSTDALRLAVTLGNTPGNNLNFSMNTVEEYSLFLNKFWNIIRFTWMNVGTITTSRETLREEIANGKKSLLPYEKWILSRLTDVIEKTTTGMNEYSFSLSGMDLLSFIRDEFADIAIEAYKIEKERSKLGKEVMSLCALEILHLVHPYIPHISEALYGYITDGKLLSVSDWPVANMKRSSESESAFEKISAIIKTIRNIRAESGIKPGELRDVYIVPHEDLSSEITANANLITGLAKISTLTLDEKPSKNRGFAYGVIHGCDIYVDAMIDESKVEEEKARLLELIKDKKEYLRGIETKLSNSSFAKNAPEKIVRSEMEKRNQALEQIEKLEEKYNALDGK